MDIEKVVDSLEAVPEALHGYYIEKDGKYHLEDVTSLRNSMQHAKRERDEAKKRAQSVDRWEKLGKSPEEIENLLAAQTKAEEDKLNKAGEWDKLKAQMNEKHQAELKAKDDALGKLRQALERHLVDAAATNAIAEAKGVPKLLLPHVRSSVRVVEEDGNFEVRVVDDKGDPRVNGKGDPLTIADLVGEMRQSEVFGRAFEASGRTGSGTPPNGSGGAGSPDLSKLSAQVRLTEYRKRENSKRT
jgi:hypothetical protein